jgi:plasmid replication initiation protein
METYHRLRQALERARSQQLTSVQAADRRLTELDKRLNQILESEANLLALRKNIEASLQ